MHSADLTPVDFSGRAARLATEDNAAEPVVKSDLKGREEECGTTASGMNSRLASRSP